MIASDVTVLAVSNFAFGRAESVPDALAAAVNIGRALDLIARGCNPPLEILRELTHPFTAPSITPPTKRFPTKMKSNSSGAVAIKAPPMFNA